MARREDLLPVRFYDKAMPQSMGSLFLHVNDPPITLYRLSFETNVPRRIFHGRFHVNQPNFYPTFGILIRTLSSSSGS